MTVQGAQSTDLMPELCGADIPVKNIWYLLLYAWNLMQLRGRWQTLVDSAPTLDALLASILKKIICQRLRVGLGRDYSDFVELFHGLRGRIDFSASVKRLAFEQGDAVCRFQRFTADVPKNQIVRSALMQLVMIGQLGPDVTKAEQLRQGLRRAVRDLEGITAVKLSLPMMSRQRLGRGDLDYRIMLAICEMIVLRQMPTELPGYVSGEALDRDAITLSRVYEAFVANFYRAHLSGWKVSAQVHLNWNTTQTSPYLPIMKPDLVLKNEATGCLVVLDTKWTPHSLLISRFGKLVFNSSHIYQMYAYLRSQEDTSNAHREAAGILLYPSAGRHLSEEIGLQGHSVRIETVDLARPWAEVEDRLLSIPRVSTVAIPVV
jgi:5-methylcytosine-specific restriction enzyme subunit McrC